jgi:hypothetical protein
MLIKKDKTDVLIWVIVIKDEMDTIRKKVGEVCLIKNLS